MYPPSSGRDDRFSEVPSSSSKIGQVRTMPNPRTASTDAGESASVPAGLTRENTSPSATMFPSAGSASAEAIGSDLGAPIQKRRRITRACDECRRKKIKCDGKQPCLHCTIYSYECTYDQPSNRSRKPHSQYVESLEQRLQQAEAMLKSLVPGIEFGDQGFSSRQQISVATDLDDRQATSAFPSPSFAMLASDLPAGSTNVPTQDNDVESLLDGTAQFEVDQHGLWHYNGYSSGLSLVKQIHKTFSNISIKNDVDRSQSFAGVSPSSFSTTSLQQISSKLFGPSFSVYSTSSGVETSLSLPTLSREVIHRLCKIALQDACTLCPIVHEPTFTKNLNRILALPKADYKLQDRRFMPLLYAVLAVGCIFAEDESLLTGEEGYKYFKASQRLLDLTDCQDILSLQSLLYIIIYLQLSANVSAYYFYIGVAVRSAYQQGLHRSFSNVVVDNREASSHLGAIEIETRKRVFWATFKLDVIISSLLGLPICSNSTQIDQEYLAEVDDEHVTENGIQETRNEDASRPSAANAHSNLVKILKRINEWIYPINGTITSSAGDAMNPDRTMTRSEADQMRKYMKRDQKIKELERDLQNWSDTLPFGLRSGGDAPPRTLRNQQLLRFLFAQTQLALYRPLLHELLAMYDFSGNSKISVLEEELKNYAGKCVSVSRNIIHIISEVRGQYLLQKDYCFAIYTTFFAFLIRASSILGGSANEADESLLEDMRMGRKALNGPSKQNIAANRCRAILESEFESLLETFLRGRSKEPRKFTERKHILSHNALSAPKTLQQPTDITMSSSSDFNSELLPIAGSSTMEQSSQQLRQQVSQKQQYAEEYLLKHKQQQYRNFMANLYPGRPVSFRPATSSATHYQDSPAATSELVEQRPSSDDATYLTEASNSDVIGPLSYMPSTTLPPNPNPQLPFADISESLFKPEDPFAYPFPPFSFTSTDVTAGTSTEQVTDIEMADYSKLNSLAAFHDNMHAAERGRNYSIEYNPSGMENDWSQGEILNSVPASVPVPPSLSAKTLIHGNVIGVDSIRDVGSEYQKQQQLHLQQRGHRHGHGQEEKRIIDQRQHAQSSMDTAQIEMTSGSVPSSSEDESNDGEGDSDNDDNQTESDDDINNDEDEDSDG